MAQFNIRYNDRWGTDRVDWIAARLDESAGVSTIGVTCRWAITLTEPGPFVEQLSAAIENEPDARDTVHNGRHIGCAFHQRYMPRC